MLEEKEEKGGKRRKKEIKGNQLLSI